MKISLKESRDYLKKLLLVLNIVMDNPINRAGRMAAFLRFLRWQVGSWLVPGKVLIPWINGSRIFAGFMMSGSAGCAYSGLHEFEEMVFCLHALRKTDLFMDVGANVGVFTVLAGAAVGCECVAVEPGSQSFKHLVDNVIINGIEKRVKLVNACVGDSDTVCRFVESKESTLSHISTEHENADATEMNVFRIDSLLEGSTPLILKMDVEGYEKHALDGAKKTLESEELKAVLIEIGTHSSRYGIRALEIHQTMEGHGFKAYRYDPFKRHLTELKSFSTQSNTLYLKDVEFILKRLKNAQVFEVFGVSL